jgi:hypothetical protein
MPKKTDKAKEEIPKTAPKMVDVSEPGKTAASATSRPVIVGHGSMIKQDPMVKEGVEVEDAKPASSGTRISIKPPEDSAEEAEEKTSEAEDTEVKPDKNEEKTSEEPTENNNAQPAKEDTNESAEETDKTNDPAEAVQADSGSMAANEIANKLAAKKEEKAKAEARTKKMEEINKLVNSRKYFVRVHQGPGGTSYSTWILIILFVAVVGIILAIDAEMLNVGLLLPFDLIK